MDSPAPGEAASSVGPWRSRGQPRSRRSRVLSPVLGFWRAPLAPSLSALASSQADRSAPPASLPGQSLFLTPGLDMWHPVFFRHESSRWKRCSFDRWAFHLLIVSVDTWARGIRRSSDRVKGKLRSGKNNERTDGVAQDG